MYIPAGMTEAQVVACMDRAVHFLAQSFKFGPFDVDDIKQQGRMMAIKALNDGSYDESRPLENFLYCHIRNRLINFRRDNSRRCDTPCYSCHQSLPGHTEHEDRQYCKPYEIWLKRNMTKHNILCPVSFGNIADEHEPNMRDESEMEEGVETKEIMDIIDQRLDIEMRADYLRMRAGETVNKARRKEIEGVVLDIIKECTDA